MGEIDWTSRDWGGGIRDGCAASDLDAGPVSPVA